MSQSSYVDTNMIIKSSDMEEEMIRNQVGMLTNNLFLKNTKISFLMSCYLI